jgi:hypothetical protein
MSAPPFVSQLRSRPGILRLAASGEPAWSVRVQVPDAWDTVHVEASPGMPVAVLKREALATLLAGTAEPHEWMVKLRGFEVLDESASLADTGAVPGSTFLLTHRRRRPVR